jgi:hypothetical protein
MHIPGALQVTLASTFLVGDAGENDGKSMADAILAPT